MLQINSIPSAFRRWLGFYTEAELRNWQPYSPLFSTLRISGNSYSIDDYRFEKRKVNGKLEYRAIALTEQEYSAMHDW